MKTINLKTILASRANIMFYAVAVLFLFTIIWALVAELDQVVRAEALVEPSGKVQKVQARYQGKVTEISALVGQRVDEGDLLFKLDDSDLDAKINQNQSIIESAEAELARLVLESQGLETWSIASELGSAVTRREQEALFLARDREQKSQDSLIRQQILRLNAAIEESRARIEGANRRLVLLTEEKAIYEPLVLEGIEPRVRLLDIQNRLEEAENTVTIEDLSVKAKKIEKQELEQRRIQAQLNFQSEARQKASEVRQRLEQAVAERAGLVDRLAATRLSSPINGTVTAVYPSGVGSVVAAGEALAEIIPDSDSFLIKAKILPKDISNVTEGQGARVSFVAYDFSKYGVLEAEVVEIAQNTTETERGEIYYDTWVRTRENTFAKSGIQPKIIPGMIAQVDILGEKRSVMEYILSPILQTTSRALTEQ
jgi:HlyD family type I secretion membrane fusion protein